MAVENLLPEIDFEQILKEMEQTDVVNDTGNLTPLFDFFKGEFVTDSNGRIVCDDGIKGMETVIAKAHATVRGLYIIYSDNYGSDEQAALRADVPQEVREMMIEEAIRDCLIYDDRVTDISAIELERVGDSYVAQYTVYTIFGEIEVDREV